ncbi:hypothetical protein vBRpoPV13_12 [Ruegeria phage vB_RpoP-V13]|uniref:Uncharacterized protein n=1 Tax=Ruegeria phage vB_RpoP-V13 TaxID=2218612 RepID=A0A2Z4QHA6_9CAUD|nr:hypothetical protein HYP63_gp12 [Ruegeria phage vB_RpoP-V13]AWY09369.1 hypothetical protein vBRpoPV13_12 [Ruegeria phage vB_RpoP-V13]
MITGEDIERCKEEAANAAGTKLMVIDTMQFFEIEIPADMDEDEFLNSDECRKECADRILNQTTDLQIDRVIDEKDENGEWISP